MKESISKFRENFSHVWETHDDKAKRVLAVGAFGAAAAGLVFLGAGLRVATDIIEGSSQTLKHIEYMGGDAVAGSVLAGFAVFCVNTEIEIDKVRPDINHGKIGHE